MNLPINSAISPSASAEQLSAACIWARLFLREADREIRKAANNVDRARDQLRAALDAIGAGQSIGDLMCECGHTHFWHEGMTGGICMVQRCPCAVFIEKEKQ